MENRKQDEQVETHAKLALKGGEHQYSSVPISEATGMPP